MIFLLGSFILTIASFALYFYIFYEKTKKYAKTLEESVETLAEKNRMAFQIHNSINIEATKWIRHYAHKSVTEDKNLSQSINEYTKLIEKHKKTKDIGQEWFYSILLNMSKERQERQERENRKM